MADARSALFVRIPAAQARRLDAQARTLGRTKQDFVTDLLATSLGASAGHDPEEHNAAKPDEVVTLGELAEMLKLNEPAVVERVAAGELPGRRFGDHWRFSRGAVLRWLDGIDAPRPGPGFSVGREVSVTCFDLRALTPIDNDTPVVTERLRLVGRG